MLNEPASLFDDHVPGRPAVEPEPVEELDSTIDDVQALVEQVMQVSAVGEQVQTVSSVEDLLMLGRDSEVLVSFEGTLHMDSEQAYTKLAALLRPTGMVAIFRERVEQRRSPLTPQTDTLDLHPNPDTPHVIHIIQGRSQIPRGGETLSAILFILTVLSVLYVGSIMAISEISAENATRAEELMANMPLEIWRGWPYALAILLILGGHEMGHYVMARRHKTSASLPYFIPFPFGFFGTFGAAIRLREPMRNRKVLMDIGVAGPLAGMVFAVPILLYGLATSQVLPISGGLVEGNSILYAASKILVFGRFLPDGEVDVYVNQLAWAGWTGLLVTGLNLIPVGQLDGGHVLYSLLGPFAKRLFLPIIGLLLALVIFVASQLMVFVALIMFMGNYHAVPLDDITPLDSRRRMIAIFALILFVLVFVPVPMNEVSEAVQPRNVPATDDVILLPIVFALAWLRHRR